MTLKYHYQDYTLPKANDYRTLTRVLGSIRAPGEYRISPVDAVTFQKFIDNHKDYKQKLQYSNSTVIAVMPHPPHDAASNYLIQEILYEVNEMCRPIRPKAMLRTGLVRLTNGIYKDADQGVYSHESGNPTFYPGLAIEAGYSDPHKKARRDVKLWLENSNLETKLGISIKIDADEVNKIITRVVFDFYDFDISHISRTNKIGRPRMLTSIDFSGYDGTDQTTPAVSSVEIPSYCVFSDGIYPQSYPAHPQPPTPVPLLISTPDRSLSVNQLQMLNTHINIVNTQRQSITINLRFVVDRLLEVNWNV